MFGLTPATSLGSGLVFWSFDKSKCPHVVGKQLKPRHSFSAAVKFPARVERHAAAERAGRGRRRCARSRRSNLSAARLRGRPSWTQLDPVRLRLSCGFLLHTKGSPAHTDVLTLFMFPHSTSRQNRRGRGRSSCNKTEAENNNLRAK